MKKKKMLAVLSCLAALSLIASCGEAVQGEKGEKGDQGETGLKGSDGKDGSTILTGVGAPNANSGKEGDLYLDTSTGNLYIKSSSAWDKTGNIKGEQGEPGDDGISITEAKINEKGELIIVFSDGTEKNLGVIKNTTKHEVNFYLDSEKLESIEVEHGERASEPKDIKKDGYDIKGWKCKEDGGYRWLFSAYPVLGDLDLYADYDYSTYTVTFIDDKFGFDQKTQDVAYKSSYDFSSVYSKLGYTCTFKTKDGDSFSSIGTYELTSDLTLYASWESAGLVVESEDLTKGKADITAINETTDGSIRYTIKATPNEGYAFDGWYNGDEWVFQWDEYEYVVSATSTAPTLTARFITEEEQAKRYAVTPEIDTDNNIVTFGCYPQTRIKDETIISKLEVAHENAVGLRCYNGDYYAHVVAAPRQEHITGSDIQEDQAGYVFEDGDSIETGVTYWFKCEKIRWRILSSDNGSYSLVTESIIDGKKYDEDSNKYDVSDIRYWLNNTFVYTALRFGASSILQETKVDNSAASTGESTNNYACDDIDNFVYLPSVKELNDSTIYPDTYKKAVATDYARAVGVDCSTEPTTYNGLYWTRSPYSGASDEVHCINYDGSACTRSVDYLVNGVRPVIKIKVS